MSIPNILDKFVGIFTQGSFALSSLISIISTKFDVLLKVPVTCPFVCLIVRSLTLTAK